MAGSIAPLKAVYTTFSWTQYAFFKYLLNIHENFSLFLCAGCICSLGLRGIRDNICSLGLHGIRDNICSLGLHGVWDNICSLGLYCIRVKCADQVGHLLEVFVVCHIFYVAVIHEICKIRVDRETYGVSYI